jgi:hypothetical protein
MVDLISEAVRLETFIESQGWRFCFIGGLAVQHWGEPRLTRDVDLVLLTGFGNEAAYVDTLLTTYTPRIDRAREFALERRVLLLRSPAGIGIDVSLAALPYEDGAIEHSVAVEMLPGARLRLCSPEDLIIMKTFAGRDTDLRDVRSVIVRQKPDSLDWRYIEKHLRDLADLTEGLDLVTRLHRIRESARD